jgi:hypothetical protein
LSVSMFLHSCQWHRTGVSLYLSSSCQWVPYHCTLTVRVPDKNIMRRSRALHVVTSWFREQESAWPLSAFLLHLQSGPRKSRLDWWVNNMRSRTASGGWGEKCWQHDCWLTVQSFNAIY